MTTLPVVYTSLPVYDAAKHDNFAELAAKLQKNPSNINFYPAVTASYVTRASPAARLQLGIIHLDEIEVFSRVIIPAYEQNKSSALATADSKIVFFREHLSLMNDFHQRARAARYYCSCISYDRASPFSEQENV